MVKIAVLGAGINGLATAVNIQEVYKDAEVVIISNEFSPETTGDGSGGLWCAFLCGNTPQELIASGKTFVIFVVHPPSLLKHLTEQFKRANGKLLQAKITSLGEPLLKEFDVVVNCTGLGSRDMVPDPAMFAVKGQVSKITAPWINAVVIDEDACNYIIPNAETCVLGGTHQEHDYNTRVDDADTNHIFNNCRRIMPGLKHATLVKHWVGLRPVRHEIRLEAEERNGKLIIHNYGHGGSGLTLF